MLPVDHAGSARRRRIVASPATPSTPTVAGEGTGLSEKLLGMQETSGAPPTAVANVPKGVSPPVTIDSCDHVSSYVPAGITPPNANGMKKSPTPLVEVLAKLTYEVEVTISRNPKAAVTL
jgi:hypothetical protein